MEVIGLPVCLEPSVYKQVQKTESFEILLRFEIFFPCF